jgi:hypothetical protein
MDATGTFLALGRSQAVEIWDVSNAASPVKVLNGSEPSRAIALWKSGASHYLATSNGTTLKLFDVSCIASGVARACRLRWRPPGARRCALRPDPHHGVVQQRQAVSRLG